MYKNTIFKDVITSIPHLTLLIVIILSVRGGNVNIPNSFRDEAIWPYSRLDLAPNIDLPSCHTVSLSEACEKCHTSSQMPNILICCTFTASVMVVLLLLLKNTVAEFGIAEYFPRCQIHCVNMVPFLVLMFHLNEHVKNLWRNGKTFLKWYTVALLLVHEDYL
jgi:hypothetical protein